MNIPLRHPLHDSLFDLFQDEQHPFRRGHNIEAMCKTIYYVRTLPGDELTACIEELLQTKAIQTCRMCRAKFLAWAALATEGLLPQKHAGYVEQYHLLTEYMARFGSQRDFMQEVVAAMPKGNGDAPN